MKLDFCVEIFEQYGLLAIETLRFSLVCYVYLTCFFTWQHPVMIDGTKAC